MSLTYPSIFPLVELIITSQLYVGFGQFNFLSQYSRNHFNTKFIFFLKLAIRRNLIITMALVIQNRNQSQIKMEVVESKMVVEVEPKLSHASKSAGDKNSAASSLNFPVSS